MPLVTCHSAMPVPTQHIIERGQDPLKPPPGLSPQDAGAVAPADARGTKDVLLDFFPAVRRGSKSGGPSPASAGHLAPEEGEVPIVIETDPVKLAERYRVERRLELEEHITDGFCDPVADGVMVDRSRDERLCLFLHKAASKLQKASTEPVTVLMVMALLVSEACGRSGPASGELFTRHRRKMRKARAAAGGRPVLLGCIMGDSTAKKTDDAYLGAALARHRALVFKVLADSLGNPDTYSTLESDAGEVAAWNTVFLDGDPFVVDVVLDPGALYEAGSAKHHEYIRLLDPGDDNASNHSFLTTITANQELRGKVPRPTWHVEPWALQSGRGEKETLGKGGFGEVFKGVWEGVQVAIKVVKVKDPTDYEVLDFILEIALLARLNHPNVMRFWRGCAEVDDGRRSLLLVTEFVDRGGLSSLLHGYGGRKLQSKLTMQQNLWLSMGIARGTYYLHACKVLHLDMKSPNVLVNGDWTPKICDFGLAKIISAASEEGGQAAFKTTIRGVSPIWAPPEMFDEEAEGMTDKADVYSFGIILFEIFFRTLPYAEIGLRNLPQAKYDGIFPSFPRDAPQDLLKMLHACYARQPTARPTMAAVVTWLQDIADARTLSLSNVVMPDWEDELEPSKEVKMARARAGQAVAAPDPAHAERVKKKKERIEKLSEECRELTMRLRQTRDNRRQMQLDRFGVALLTGERVCPGGSSYEATAETTTSKSAKEGAADGGEERTKTQCCRLL